MNCKQLPKNYRQIAMLDFVRNRKLLLRVGVASLIINAIMIVLGIFLGPFSQTVALVKAQPWTALVAVAMFVAYIPLHELTHGLLMHALSGVRPNYGISLCYAYAGSRIFFDRREHILIALAPVALWGVVLGILAHALPAGWFWLVYIVQITNVSGSVGDFYCSFYLMRLPKDTLVQDTGTRMRIFTQA